MHSEVHHAVIELLWSCASEASKYTIPGRKGLTHEGTLLPASVNCAHGIPAKPLGLEKVQGEISQESGKIA
jgi:hypothetical protein